MMHAAIWLAHIFGVVTASALQQHDQSQAFLGPLPNQPLGNIACNRTLTLRHVQHHGSHKYPHLHRYIDFPGDAERDRAGGSKSSAVKSVHIRTVPMQVERLIDHGRQDIDDLLAYARFYGQPASLPPSAWAVREGIGPDVTDKETVLSFAKMASNAYAGVNHSEWKWKDIGTGFDYSDDFGWEEDGLRGHIFVDDANSTLVIALKGTSVPCIDDPDTTQKDLINDNIFGSCCCAQGGHYAWKTVCSCKTSSYTCDSTCLVKELRSKNHYYQAAREIYHAVSDRYPDSEVWLTGHSLGGVVSSLIGLTYVRPTVTFEAYPDALAASHLGLPTPPGHKVGADDINPRPKSPVHHFGHTADPIYMGTCQGLFSYCTLFGYAFEGLCHTGRRCTYDTVKDLNWTVDVRTHSIDKIIEEVLQEYDQVADCREDIDCMDCANWKYVKSACSASGTKTSSSGSSTATEDAIVRS